MRGQGASHVIGLYFRSQTFYFHFWLQFVLPFGPLWRRWTVILHPRLLSNDAALDELRLLCDSSGTCSSGLMAKLTNWTDTEWKGQEGKLWKATEDRGEPFKGFCSLLPGVISCTWVWDWDGAMMVLPIPCSVGTWGQRGELRLQAPPSLFSGPWQPCASCCTLRCFAFLELMWFFCYCCFMRYKRHRVQLPEMLMGMTRQSRDNTVCCRLGREWFISSLKPHASQFKPVSIC